MARVSVNRAIWTGLALVNGPVLVLLLGPMLLMGLSAVGRIAGLALPGWAQVTVAVAGVAAGWLWWALAAPRWRVWALERVAPDAWDDLLFEAVSLGILWAPGHTFAKTEIRPAGVRERERALEWSD